MVRTRVTHRMTTGGKALRRVIEKPRRKRAVNVPRLHLPVSDGTFDEVMRNHEDLIIRPPDEKVVVCTPRGAVASRFFNSLKWYSIVDMICVYRFSKLILMFSMFL